jgi:L-fuconolactonase
MIFWRSTMLNFPLVDSHVHFWNPQLIRYPWLEDIPALNKPFLLADYNHACEPVVVDKMVFIQCEADYSQFMHEVEWVDSLAKVDNRLQGIVPWSPLENGDAVRPTLERLAVNPRIKGIRRLIGPEPDPEFCLHPKFIQGVQALADYEFSFDMTVSPRHLANISKMVMQCPDIQFVLDHIGNPDIKNNGFNLWQNEIKTLAEFPNVWCKISSLPTLADHQTWTKEQLKPYIDHVLDCFGFERVMYGGDWPVASQAIEYPAWVDTLLWAVNGCSDDELRQLFRVNAIKFYRLA